MSNGARSLLVLCLAGGLVLGCSRSRDQLLADLQSPKPELRATAVRKLAGKGNPDDLVLFTRAAKDLSPDVRAEAAVALGQSADARVVDLLGELLEDPSEDVQGKAAMALSRVSGDKARAYLTSQYARRGHRTRQVIVQALRATRTPQPVATAVTAEAKALWDATLLALEEGSLAERVAAAEVLGKSGRPEAVSRLLALLRDPQVLLAAAAVRGLGEAGDRSAVGSIALLLDENQPELRDAASRALGQLGDAQVTARLRAVALERSAASRMATEALAALPRLADTDAALCAVVLEGAEPEAQVAGAVMRSRGGCALDPLVERLGRPAQQAAALAAVHALGPAAKAALPRVLPLLERPEPALRARAAEALGALGDGTAAAALQRAYDAELEAVEALRTDWVAKREGAAPGSPELAEDVPAERLAPLVALLGALAQVHAPEALATLRARLDDPAGPVRLAARVGLAALGKEGAALARKGLEDPAPDVRKAVALALAETPEGREALAGALPGLADATPVLEVLLAHGAPASLAAHLTQRLEAHGPDAGLAAALLGALKVKAAVPALVAALAPDSDVDRRPVLLALGDLGDREAAEIVARHLLHEHPEVRAAAATALSRIGAGSQAEALDALRGDYYRAVREAAGEAMARVSAAASDSAR